MATLFKKIIHRVMNSSGQLPSDPLSSVAVPRYPPFTEGFPRHKTDELLDSQSSIIKDIAATLRINNEQFNHLALPVISNYASYCHLLPASERHHHRGMGGLFRHGLEVAKFACQFAQANQFCPKDLPRLKRDNENRWQFAAFVAGLTHDLGKPLSDLVVRDRSGEQVWNPYEITLVDWLYTNDIDRYFIGWNGDRNKRHKNYSLLLLPKILTDEVSAYLNKTGPQVFNALLESLMGTSAIGTLTSLVVEADQASVTRDLANSALDIDEYSFGIPIERYFFDALRTYVTSASINTPGSTVWVTQNSIFLSWPRVADDIYQLIQSDKIPGYPRSADTVADILLERAFATFYADEQGVALRYWPLSPEPLKGLTLNCLRLDDLSLVFTSQPPPSIASVIGSLSPEPKVLSHAEIISELVEPSPSEDHSVEPLEQTTSPTVAPLAPQDGQVIAPDILSLSDQKPTAQSEVGPPVKTEIEVKNNIKNKEAKEIQLPRDENVVPGSKKRNKIIGKTVDRSQSVQASSDDQLPEEVIILLDKIITLYKEGQEVVTKVSDGSFAILYPSNANLVGKPNEVLELLRSTRSLKLQSGLNTATQRFDGKTYLVLTNTIKKVLQQKGYLKLSQSNEQVDSKPVKEPAESEKKSRTKSGLLPKAQFVSNPSLNEEIDRRKNPEHGDFTVVLLDGAQCLALGPQQILEIAKRIQEPIISVKMGLNARIDYHSDDRRHYYLRLNP